MKNQLKILMMAFAAIQLSACSLKVNGTSNTTTVAASATATPTATPASGYFSGGTGTAGDPYLIANATDLEEFSTKLVGADYNSFKDKYYKQTANIDLGGTVKSYIPIGVADAVVLTTFSDYANVPSTKPFLGEYDGNSKKIQNLKLQPGTQETYYGFFIALGSSAVVKNLIFENPVITMDGMFVGTVAGFSSGSLTGISVTGLNATMAIAQAFGGLVGNQHGGGISNSSVSGTFSGSTTVVYDSGTDDIIADTENIGGIAGFFMNFSASVTPVMSNVSSSLNITAASGVAGIVPLIIGQVQVDHASNSGVITSHQSSAGVICNMIPASWLGLSGLTKPALSYLSNTGTINVNGTGGKYTSAAGLINGGQFTLANGYNTGNVVNNHPITGVAAGILNSPILDATISKVYSTGDISLIQARFDTNGVSTPYGQVAGLVSVVAPGNSLSLTNSYSTGALVTEVGENNIGSVIASLYQLNTSDSITVQNVYSANSYVGGSSGGAGKVLGNIVLSQVPTLNFQNIYWASDGYGPTEGLQYDDSSVNAFVIAGGNDFRSSVVNLTNAQMLLQASFAGFDFGADWNAPGGATYPTLR